MTFSCDEEAVNRVAQWVEGDAAEPTDEDFRLTIALARATLGVSVARRSR